MTYRERYALARLTEPGDVWRHRKTGKEVVVIKRIGLFGIGLSHQSGKRSMKLDHYLASDYEKVEPDSVEIVNC